MENNQAIGVFDSGIGGLTVANAIQKVLPQESLLYFGDTRHLPYGEKSALAIQEFARRISRFLLSKNCKMIVIACNTASSVAYEVVKEIAPNIPVINVIDPVVKHITSQANLKKVGVIGTKRTINSNIYSKKLLSIKPQLNVSSLATPLLAPMIEEGFFSDKISQTIIENYLKDPQLKDIEQLVLACTHYPLVQDIIAQFYQNDIEIIDSASQVAKVVKSTLFEQNIISTSAVNHQFFVSDYTQAFEKSAKYFFHDNIHLMEISIT